MPEGEKAAQGNGRQVDEEDLPVMRNAILYASLFVIAAAIISYRGKPVDEFEPEEYDGDNEWMYMGAHQKRPLSPQPIPTPAPKGFPRENPFALEIPRVNLQELEANATLLSGHHAFVLTDVQQEWRANAWTLSLLKNKIPFEWVDYYPRNMDDLDAKPYLYRLEEALPLFRARSGVPKYMQMRISVRGWKRLRKDIRPMPDTSIFWSDDTWIRHCMKHANGTADEDAISNFYTTNQWKFLLIGERGTSMYFHKDGTAASSWQAMIQGRKKWTLCPNTQSQYLEVGIDTFKPDYDAHPEFARALCGQTIVGAGEMVYYPAYWWHHTYQLDTPSIAYTGALVGTEAEYSSTVELDGMTKAHRKFYYDLMEKCDKCWKKGKKERICEDISLTWPGAAPPPSRKVCQKYLPRCYELWDQHAESIRTAR